MKMSDFFTINIQKKPGFRINLIDAGVIVFFILLTCLLYPVLQDGGYFYYRYILVLVFFFSVMCLELVIDWSHFGIFLLP